MAERWIGIPEYEDRYEVSDLGRVRSLERRVPGRWAAGTRVPGRVLRPGRTTRGYFQVQLCRDGIISKRFIHRLVLEAFVGPSPEGQQACHWNGDPLDNRLENLRWDTASANQLDNVRLGVHPNARKTGCPQGHPYSPDNTFVLPDGKRACRTCNRTRKIMARAKVVSNAN